MTPLTNFHCLFEPHIITRGRGYLNSVLQLKNDFGNHWTALVKGTHRYKVEIELLQNGWGDVFIDNMNCSCEYWDNCKHQVAVLLKLQEKLKNNELKINNKEQIPSLQQLLEQSDKQTLINFILQLNQNQPIENEFLLFVNKNTNVQTNSTQINKAIQQKISDILTLDDENEWEEFVFDEQIDELTQLLSEFDHQPNNKMMVAITWIDNVLAIYDDIFDEISQSIEICLTVLGKHLFNIGDYQADWNADFLDNTCQVDKEFLDTLLVLLETWKDVTARTSYVISVEIERFYFDLHWAMSEKDIALTWLDELLVIAKCHNDYRFDNILKIKIQALHALNQPTEQLIDEYLHLPAICALKVGRLLDNGEVQKAVQLIKETIQTGNNNTNWYKKLVEIGQNNKDITLIREHSFDLITNNQTLDLVYLTIYKNTFESYQWQEQKSWLEQQLSKQNQWFILAEFYYYEQEFDKLLALTKQQNNRRLVEQYLSIVLEKDLDWLSAFFISYWQEKITTINKRTHYRYFASDIKHLMEQIPTAKPIWQAQVETWKREFAKRPALVDELKKI